MQQFDLSVWLQDKSRKVVTRDGREVRILDYNLKGDKRICIAVDDKTQESITTVDEDGHCLRDKTGWHESNFDLFFADEGEKLTEFETAIYHDVCTIVTACEGTIYDDEELKPIVKGIAKVLLSLARREALKSLPKWKKATEHKEFNMHVCVMDEDMYPYLDIEVNEGEYYIEFSDLKHLPKEE